MQRSKRAVMTLFGEARLGKAIDAEQCLPLVEEVAELGGPQSVGADQPGEAEDQGRLHLHALGGGVRADGGRWRGRWAWTSRARARPAWPVCCMTSAR